MSSSESTEKARGEYSGPERRRYVEPIHPWRWRLLAIWIVLFTVSTFYVLRQSRDIATKNRQNIHQLQMTKAQLDSLQKTNCNIRIFLDRARAARLAQAKTDKGATRQVDIDTARSYTLLIQSITAINEECPIKN